MKGDSIMYREGYKYQLASDYSVQTSLRPFQHIDLQFITLTADGVLVIRKGYAWDGASGPTIDTKNSMRGSLVHDALYQLIRTGAVSSLQRKAADKMLRDICIEDGMSRARAYLWYWGVTDFGQGASLAEHERKVQTAP